MSVLWLLAVTIHLLAAVTWIGGMIFLSTVLAPLMRGGNVSGERRALFGSAARRFRLLVWLSIFSLLITGPVLLHEKNISFSLPTEWPVVLRIKLSLVALLLLLTIAHDLYLGPRSGQLNRLPSADRTPLERMIMVTGRWLARVSISIAVAVVAAAVILARS